MDDEWMADVNVPGSTGREGSGSFERRGRKIATVELHTAFAVRRKHAGYVQVRTNDELRRCIVVADVREQRERASSPPRRL